MKNSLFLILTLSAALITGCSHDNDSPEDFTDSGVNTTEAFASFSIAAPAGLQGKSGHTRATDAGNAAESTVKTLDVFIYDVASTNTITVANFNTADGSLQKTATGWKTANAIRTLKADKYIFAGLNLTPAIVTEIKARGFGSFSYKEFAQTVSDLANADNGFVMFNAAYPAITPADKLSATKDEAEAAPLPIQVSRVVAKAAVFKGKNFVVNGGGEMQNITYGWRNINKRFYFIQKIEGGIVKDYNWEGYATNDFARGNDTLNINAYQASPTEFTYATENNFNYIPQASLVDQSTFLSIRGQFRPDEIIGLKAGVTDAKNSDDFQTVTNPNGYGTFYVVRTDDGISNYFITGTVAQQYANLCLDHAAGMPALSQPYSLGDNTYADGKCYFHVLVNSDATGQYTPYGIYRNQYYRVNLNSIQAPGNPSDNFDQGKVISPNTYVNVEINISDWEIVDKDYDL